MNDRHLCDLHRHTAERLRSRIALRHKRDGLFHDLTWTDYRRQADEAAAGLIALGIQPGDRVAILSENRFEWLIADHAILSGGAADVPLHAPLAAAQVEYQVGHSESRGIIVSGQTQADKVFAVLASLPVLEFLVSFEPIVSPANCRLKLLTWQGLKHRGWQTGEAGRQEIARREAALTGRDLATIIYTSGTTGNPKGVMLSHDNLLTNAASTGKISFMEPDDVLLSWLPYSHIYARTVDHYLTTWAGVTLALAESIETLVSNLAEIRPTWLTAVPRFYEKVWNNVAGQPPQQRDESLRKLFGPRIKQLTSGGAPLPRHVCEAFHAAGIPLLEGYGLTESSPVISFNNAESFKIGSVGRMIEDVEVRIADDGEILTRGPHVMQGYWKNPTATSETIRDGWLHTGDVGQLDDEGFLSITDRKKDLFVTSAGKNIAPSELERLLTSDPFIDQAVVYGDGRHFISALIVPNEALLRAEAEKLGCGWSVSAGFVTTAALTEFIQSRIDVLMEVVSQPERVKRCLLLDRPFQLVADELTATMKVRRRHILAKYERELAALYDPS
ncbi:MAG: AMP-dependent synthetase/ligase [Planctomycetaceae bacterium]